MTLSDELIQQLTSLQELPDPNQALDESSGEQAASDASRKTDVPVEESNDEQDWMTCLLQSPLFTRIPLSQLQELFKKFDSVEYKKDEVIVKEGAQGDFFYVVASGSAHISNKSGSVDLNIRPGDHFGEESLVSKAPRNATVTMTSNGVVKRLSSDDFFALLQEPVLRYVDLGELENSEKPYKLLDVKMPIEYRFQHVPGSINVPLSRLRKSLSELASHNTYVVSGDAGSRADIAAYLLCQAGFDAVVLKGEKDSLENPPTNNETDSAPTVDV